MTATTAAAQLGPLARAGMPGLGRMITTETMLYLRDPGNLFFILIFPTVLLLGTSFIIPGMREVITDAPPPFAGVMVAHLFAPTMFAVAIATAGLAALPAYLAGYRESGVLRRLSTTPMRPQGLLIAQVVVNLVALLLGGLLALVVGALVLGVPLPNDWPLAIAGVLLGTGAIFGVGLIIGGLAPKATIASGIGMSIYFPMLFFAGLWTPGPAMPEAVATIAQFTPLGAASQTLTAAWFGGTFPLVQLVVMAVWTVVTLVVAARTFRWN